MKTKLFAIAKITKASGLKGAVGIKPLIRQFDEYVDKDLFIGFDENFASDIKLANRYGTEKNLNFFLKVLNQEVKLKVWLEKLFLRL